MMENRKQYGTSSPPLIIRFTISLILVLLVIQAPSRSQVQASGVFEFELLDFQRLDHGHVYTSKETHQQVTDLNKNDRHQQPIRLFICLKEAFTSQLDGPCTFGNATLTIGKDDDATSQTRRLATLGQEQKQTSSNITIEQDDQQAASEARGSHLQSRNETQFNLQKQHELQHQQRSLLTNVVRILFTFRWTKSFTIIISGEQMAPDDHHQPAQRPNIQLNGSSGSSTATPNTSTTTTGTTTNRTAEARQQVSFSDRHVLTENEVLPNLETNPHRPWTSRFSRSLKSSLVYRFRVFCSLNYYGDGCTTFCRPRDDQFGHYNCSSTGQKVCLDGWQGADCDRARCRPGCNQQHGFCDKPDTCLCRPGWSGARCDECITYPGCQNGYCLSPWQCICKQNWGGVLCDQDLDYCGSRQPCQNNATCQNVAPGRYRCDCQPGFTGSHCDTQLVAPVAAPTPAEPMSLSPILAAGCALNPCLNGGTCFVFNSQLVDLHGSGERSVDDSNSSSLLPTDSADDEQPTEVANNHASSYRCQCPPGWTGDFCQWSSDMVPVSADTPNSSVQPAEQSLPLDQINWTPGDQTNQPQATNNHHLDMKHLISGVVVASVVGVFMAASLLAWCCLIAIERNRFPFIQMNIIRCGADQARGGQQQPSTSTSAFRRFQEKLRSSLRLASSSSSRSRIKPETRLSIENVLRPPPSYEETTRHLEGPSGGASCEQQSKANSAPIALAIRVEKQEEDKPNLVIRGAIEREMASKQSKRQARPVSELQSTQVDNIIDDKQKRPHHSHNNKDETQQQQRQIVNCPRHGPLYISGNMSNNTTSNKASGDFIGIEHSKEQPTTTIEIEYQPQTISLASRQQHLQQTICDTHDTNNYTMDISTNDISHADEITVATRHTHSNQYHRLDQRLGQQQHHLYQYGGGGHCSVPSGHHLEQPQSIYPSLHRSAHDKALARQ